MGGVATSRAEARSPRNFFGENAAKKTCAVCGSELPPRVAGSPGRTRKYCFECIASGRSQAAWRQANSEKIESYNRSRRVGPRQTFCSECGKVIWTLSTKTTCSQVCRGKRARRLNADGVRARYSRKNARRAAQCSGGDVSKAEVRALLASRTFCPLCRKKMTDEPGLRQKHIDHIVPLCIGGGHLAANVRVICRTCNLARPTDGSDLPAAVLRNPALSSQEAVRRADHRAILARCDRAERTALQTLAAAVKRVACLARRLHDWLHDGRELRERSRRRVAQQRSGALYAAVFALRVHGWGYKRIGRELGLDRTSVRARVRRLEAA
jgi:hypothetical protein